MITCKQCSRLGSEENRAVDFLRCVKCGDENPADFEFCGTCGFALSNGFSEGSGTPAGSLGPNSFSGPPATLVVIHPDGSEGERYQMLDNGYVGRAVTPMFADDSFLSPKHFLLKTR